MRQTAQEIAVAPGLEPRRVRRADDERALTIGTSFDERANQGRGRTVPMIRMRGRWLQRLGFRKGERVLIEERRGELVIRLAREE